MKIHSVSPCGEEQYKVQVLNLQVYHSYRKHVMIPLWIILSEKKEWALAGLESSLNHESY